MNKIRADNPKITSEFRFCDGNDMIELDTEENYEIGDIIDADSKVYIKSKNSNNNNTTTTIITPNSNENQVQNNANSNNQNISPS